MRNVFVKIFSLLLYIFSILALGVKNPTFPNPYKTVDLSKFEMTFEEEFDGELDRSLWVGHYTYGKTSSVRRGSYWNNYMAYTENGNLVIPLKYLDEGMGGTGAGWYTAGLDTSSRETGFRQKFGYFEVRCILPKGSDIWSAFWMMNEDVFNVDGSGQDGDDLYFNVTLGENTYTFTVESYLCDNTTDVYNAVKNLSIGDKIDMEGFLYWYEGANPHITSVTPAA